MNDDTIATIEEFEAELEENRRVLVPFFFLRKKDEGRSAKCELNASTGIIQGFLALEKFEPVTSSQLLSVGASVFC